MGTGAAPLAPDVLGLLRAAPKVELHLHLDGAMSLPWLLERTRRRPAGAVSSLEDLGGRLAFRTFDEFIERWVWKCGFLDRYEDFESLAESVLRELAELGVVHVEPSISQGDYVKAHGLEAPGIVEAVLRGMERATRAHGLTCGLIVDLIRNHGPAVAARRLEEITPTGARVSWRWGLGGASSSIPPGPFADVYAEAARRGFHRTAHAGEVAGPDSVREALDRLGVERVDHGIRTVEDPALVARLARDLLRRERARRAPALPHDARLHAESWPSWPSTRLGRRSWRTPCGSGSGRASGPAGLDSARPAVLKCSDFIIVTGAEMAGATRPPRTARGRPPTA